MGASASVDLRPDDIAEIEDITVYEPKEIKSLYKRFMRLDRGKKGTLAVEDLLMVPEVSMNPLAGRLTCLFDRDADGRINFRSFAAGLSTFSERARTDVRKRGAWLSFQNKFLPNMIVSCLLLSAYYAPKFFLPSTKLLFFFLLISSCFPPVRCRRRRKHQRSGLARCGGNGCRQEP